MAAGIWFWIIFVICFLFGGFMNRAALGTFGWNYGPIFVLIFLLGWTVYGSPIK